MDRPQRYGKQEVKMAFVVAVKGRPDFISVLLYFTGPSGSMTPIHLVLIIEYRLSWC